eukprot:TRINITY_DN502_c4_g1_i1.p1 TRINITY_DN502_c4_g1~~TRINITY_DN502_c4_g1_i1.p1  ORF type:complete len:300 (+),score=134.16 TRINITY_DN502_c4_g1_i1:93-992(+)
MPQCIVSRDQSIVPVADAVLIEVINHFQFNGDQAHQKPIILPATKPENQLWINFHFENKKSYPIIADENMLKKFDVHMTPSLSSDIPISLTCPWTNNYQQFLVPPPSKPENQAIAAYFSYDAARSNSQPRTLYVEQMLKTIKIDIYGGPLKNADIKFQKKNNWINEELKLIGSYKFVLAFEFLNETGWVTQQLSQAFLAGAVPVYMGADNIDEYLPAPNSIIKASDFANPTDLAIFLKELATKENEYLKYFDWKKNKRNWRELDPKFVTQLNNCVYYAECRLCELVYQRKCDKIMELTL